MKQPMKIAVLLTCHNRREKTCSCLRTLYSALDCYNASHDGKVDIVTYLTDDGCSDGTTESVLQLLHGRRIHILQGNGALYWAGGMRFAWQEAIKYHNEWDYYLLVNDDTDMMPNLFEELFFAQDYAVIHYGMQGIVSGITCAKNDPKKLTYGGDIWVNKVLGTSRRLRPNDEPQLCDFTNANILLVPIEIVDKIGVFYSGFSHGYADYDYAIMARKAGIPVLLTACFCGKCDDDHVDEEEVAQKLMSMSFKERKAYFNNPIHSNRDHLRFIIRTAPLRLPAVWIGRKMNLYWPRMYYLLNRIRKQ